MSAPQSTHEKPDVPDWRSAFLRVLGSLVWTLKIKFDVGKSMPRINWARFADGGNDGPCVAVRAVCGVAPAGGAARNVICFSAASSALSSDRPAGNLPARSR